MTKYQEILLQVRFFTEGDRVFQHFIVVKDTQKKYLLNSRYVLNRRFEGLIEKNALSLKSNNYTFISRVDELDRIILEFGVIDKTKGIELKTFFANIAGDIPSSDCCDECEYFDTDGDTWFCTKKQKQLNRRLKNCRFFQQKNKK